MACQDISEDENDQLKDENHDEPNDKSKKLKKFYQ